MGYHCSTGRLFPFRLDFAGGQKGGGAMGSRKGAQAAAARALDAESRLQIESALRRAIEASVPAGIAVADLEGRQTYVSPAFCEMVGWTEKELVGARAPFVYWPPEEAEAIGRAFEFAARGEAPESGFEFRFQRRSGDRFEVLIRARPLHLNGGEIAGWVASVVDMAGQKRIERLRAAEHDVARALATSRSAGAVADKVLGILCERLGWEAGALWRLEPGGAALHCASVWRKPEATGDRFESATRELQIERGVGLPGRVWDQGAFAWVPNTAAEADFLRGATAASAGLKSAFSFPLTVGERLVGTIEVFGRNASPPDAALLDTAAAIGSQIGHFIDARQTEEALRGREVLYRTIVETANEGVWLIDGSARTVFVNRRLTEMLGYAPDEMLGRTVFEFCFPQDVRTVADRIAVNMRGASEQFDFRFRKKNGEELMTLASTSPMRDTDGRISGALGLFSDVTDRKREEDAVYRLAAIVESSEDAIIGKNLEGTIETWNSAAERLYGYTAAEAIGKSITMLAPPDRADEEPAILKRLQRGERVEHFETVRVRKDGRSLHVSMTISPIRDRSGRIRGASNVTRDITEQRAFESQWREMQKLESLGVLAGGIAHDFNNLLVGIMGNASLALDVLPPGSDARDMIQGILQASERAANLTRQLLAYSGRGRFVVQTMELATLIEEIIALIQTSIPRTVRLTLDLDPDTPPIEADVTQIHQLIMNLVINAAEAIAREPGSVVLRTRRHLLDVPMRWGELDLPPGAYAAIIVEDTGCGIDEATRARIFDPFFTTKFTGRGLGLAAALGIVRGHRGAIRVDSVVGAGSTFTVLLPAAMRVEEDSAAHEFVDLCGSGTILVVDDEDVVRHTAKSALERYGYSVLLAGDGSEAVRVLARTRDISLVLLDLTMPLMSGQEALRGIRDLRPDVPVVLSSGFSESEAVQRFDGLALAGFLQKPYTAEQVAEKIKQVLEAGTPG